MKILLTRKPRLIAGSVPRLSAVLNGFRVDRDHLARYREICGERESNELPIAYLHVLATPVHLAMVASDDFPLSLVGVVHIRNRIVQKRPVRVDDMGQIQACIDGHRETGRGQEIDLRTDVRVDGDVVWSEICTFLARRGRRGPLRTGRGFAHAVEAPPPQAVRTRNFVVDAGIGRRYARVSGDYNPIHIADLAARFFGFKRAIAHGMWSLARCAAELGPDAFAGPCTLDVAFRLPLLFPAQVVLESWSDGRGLRFALRDARRTRSHLLGRVD